MSGVWKRIAAWVFPVSCIGCSRAESALCPACAPAPADRIADIVGNVGLAAAGEYTGTLRHAIVAMKRGERAYLEPFGMLIARLIVADVALIPLPTTGRRRAARGFDQAVELARRAGAARGLPCVEALVKRGGAQRGRGRLARLESGGRFGLKRGVALPARALVVDDVCTTGTTIAGAVATLESAGVTVVGAIVLARTPVGRNSRT